MTTKLGAFLDEHGLDDETFAARLRRRRLRVTGSWISKIRRGANEPSKKLARGIEAETKGAVSFADLIDISPKRSAA